LKKLTVILILFVQLGALFTKTATIVHFFLHREEIIEHFCHHDTHEEEENCQGICYLKAELSKDDNSPVKNFPVNSLVQEEVVYFEIPQVFSLKTPHFKDIVHQNFIVKTPVLYETHLSVWRPPTAA
jgi:uncharacterized protein with NAD-binding domain and iron-sulfur cluster